MIDEGKLWSLIRNVLTQGAAIQLDRASCGYEEYSARLDSAAADRVADFAKLCVDGSARITELETALTVRETEIARLETDLELARAEVSRLDQRVDGLRSAIEHGQAIRAIDAARGGP